MAVRDLESLIALRKLCRGDFCRRGRCRRCQRGREYAAAKARAS